MVRACKPISKIFSLAFLYSFLQFSQVFFKLVPTDSPEVYAGSNHEFDIYGEARTLNVKDSKPADALRHFFKDRPQGRFLSYNET